jgi:hypothetical protein
MWTVFSNVNFYEPSGSINSSIFLTSLVYTYQGGSCKVDFAFMQ